VDLDDVGVGVSQVIPVITAAAIRQKAYIQQPELHLHPKMQASIADVFIAALNMQRNPYLNPPIFILETHSELLALRVLRRICETNRAQIKDRKLELNPDSVSIIYVDKNDKGETTLTKLRISEAGEFLDRWPDGFFAERDAELFYD
jgi:predicted ATPase